MTNSTAKVEWRWSYGPRDPECGKINGAPTDYRIELYVDGKIDSTVFTPEHVHGTMSYTLVNLRPETQYEARIYLRNEAGYNAIEFLSFSFKTKS